MGRHSAPDDTGDTEDTAAATATDIVAPPAVPGRHAAPEDDAAPAQPDQHAPAGRRERATQADLRLLREHPALRARCVAAALAPFVVYTVVLFALATVHIYVLWLWAPIIAAGILVGAVLDAAHKRMDAPPPDEGEDEGRDEAADNS